MASNVNTDHTIDFTTISWDSLRNELKSNEDDEIWLKTIDEQVQKSLLKTSETTNTANDYMKWARERQKHVKMKSSPIPSSTLGANIIQGDLIDIRISSRGPDDILYDRDEQFRKRLPRGCTLIEYKRKGETTSSLDFAVFALRKFSGGLGDDDDRQDNNQAWLRYFLQDPSMASKIISTRKVNGEACHLSCVFLPPDNRPILIAGSKNVHLAFRTHHDINRYSDDSTYTYAKPFCRVILHTLANMPDHGRKLIHFLAMTRYTAVFEALSYHHQHVVDLSYLKDEPYGSVLKFLSFSQVPDDFDDPVTSLCSLRPDFSIDIGKRLHLLTTDYEIIQNEPTILNDYLRSIKYRPYCEGSVLYFINERDQVIGLLKKKTIWYVILRAIREKVRFMISQWEKTHKLDQADTIRKTCGRLNAIQRWLGFSNEILERWKNLANDFIDWLAEEVKRKKITRTDISDRYPILWRQFLEQRNRRDDFMVEISPADEEVWKHLNEPSVKNERVGDAEQNENIDEDID